MMLATCCPYCHTSFRVVQDQLKICNGIVRCGSCRQVFNGIEQLQTADAAIMAASQRAENAATWPESAEANPNPVTIVAEPGDKAFFSEAHDDLNLILTPAEEGVENAHTSLADTPYPVFVEEAKTSPEPALTEEAEPDLVLHLDARKEPQLSDNTGFEEPHQSTDDIESEHRFEPTLPEAFDDDDDPAYKVEIKSQREELAEVAAQDEPTEPAEPAFVQRARRQERFGRLGRIAMALLILGLLPALVLQTVDAFHQRIAAAFPQAKPYLEQICQVIECQAELPSQIDAVSVDASELQAPTGKEKSFTLNVLLRNRSPLAQTWPYVELTLNDIDEKPVLRRVFVAEEYLTAAKAAAAGFPPNSEHSVKLVFEVESQLKPVGYRVYLFYP